MGLQQEVKDTTASSKSVQFGNAGSPCYPGCTCQNAACWVWTLFPFNLGALSHSHFCFSGLVRPVEICLLPKDGGQPQCLPTSLKLCLSLAWQMMVSVIHTDSRKHCVEKDSEVHPYSRVVELVIRPRCDLSAPISQ